MLLANLQRNGHQVSGCEINAQIAKKGSEALAVDISAGAFEDQPLDRDRFDYVISFHTLEHIPDPLSVLAKIAEVLRADVTVVLEVPAGEEEYSNLDHLHFFPHSRCKPYSTVFLKRPRL